MTQIENGFYEIIEMAKQLEKEGICSVSDCEDSSIERRFSINWDIQTGEDFVKASALVHAIDEWAQFMDNENHYIVYSVEDGYTGKMLIIEVFCVWL